MTGTSRRRTRTTRRSSTTRRRTPKVSTALGAAIGTWLAGVITSRFRKGSSQ